jgi:hypothetical protein
VAVVVAVDHVVTVQALAALEAAVLQVISQNKAQLVQQIMEVAAVA